jgi:hemerythrin-like domain-containing protein
MERKTPEVAADLVLIHSVISNSLEIIIKHTSSSVGNSVQDKKLREGFIIYLRCFSTFVHNHHQLEDELMFPYCRKSMPSVPYDLLSTQHMKIKSFLDIIDAGVKKLADRTKVEGIHVSIHGWLEKLRELWYPHIGLEEQNFGDTNLATVYDMGERIHLGRMLVSEGQKHNKPISLMLPFILFNLSPEERLTLEKAMIPWFVPHILVPYVWKSQWKIMVPFFAYPPF